MSSTPFHHFPPESFTAPPRGTARPDGDGNGNGDNGNDNRPKSSSLYLFTFLSTLFLLLVVSTAIVLRSFLLRRRYRLRLQSQFDEIFLQPGDESGKRNFGAKPKLWDTWTKPDGDGRGSANELADIKPLAAMYVPQEANKPKNLSSPSSVVPQPDQEHRHDRSATFLGLFASPLPPARHPCENDHPGGDSANSSSEIPRTVQVAVVVSLPSPTRKTKSVSNPMEEEFPNVAIGLTRLRIANE